MKRENTRRTKYKKSRYLAILTALMFNTSTVTAMANTYPENIIIPAITTQYYISWTFTIYSEPNFTSDIIMQFSPQTVTIIARIDNGWALIDTYLGQHWVYLNGNIDTITDDLDTFIAQYGDGISVYYENIETGYAYSHNEKKQYYAASIIKAPYVMYLYSLVDNGEINLNDTLTYTVDKYRDGSGIVKNMSDGTILTIGNLLNYSITESDNIAFRMLLGTYGVDGFKDYLIKSGGRTDTLHSLTNAFINIKDTAFYAKEICNFIGTPGTSSETMRQDLLSTATNYIVSDYPTVNKYGLWDKAMHDMAIVYSESPYILVIMTDMGVANDDDTPLDEPLGVFKDISQKFQEVNNIFE